MNSNLLYRENSDILLAEEVVLLVVSCNTRTDLVGIYNAG